MIVTANSTCVLLARENMITQRINTHLAGAKCAIVRMGKQLVKVAVSSSCEFYCS